MTALAPLNPEQNLSGLGRRYAPDERDNKYLLRKETVPPAVTSKYWLSLGDALDQGATSECVIYSTDKWLSTRPVVNAGFLTAAERTKVYERVQEIDEWPGTDYDGTSVRAMFKWLKANGLCSEYRWGFDLDTVVAHVLTKGPVVMGTDWYMDMFTPDWDGYIEPRGSYVGGHAWTIIGINRKRKNPDGTTGAARMINSWGSGWGQNGKAWLTFETLEQLIEEQGEAAVAVEVKEAA